MTNFMELKEDLQERFKVSLYFIINWRRRGQIISVKSILEDKGTSERKEGYDHSVLIFFLIIYFLY